METQISWQLTAFICLLIRKFVGNENLTEGSSSFILHLNKINSDLFKKKYFIVFFFRILNLATDIYFLIPNHFNLIVLNYDFSNFSNLISEIIV